MSKWLSPWAVPEAVGCLSLDMGDCEGLPAGSWTVLQKA